MSFNAAALKLMADKGLTAHDIAEIAAANEKRADPTATERKRRQRQKEMSQRDVTRDPAPNDIDILTPTLTPNGISSEIPAPVVESEPIELKPEHVVEVWNELATRHGLAAVKKITP